MVRHIRDAGAVSRILEQFTVEQAVPSETMLEQARSALSRRLPRMKRCRPHDRTMCIAGGGPSLEDTWAELDGVVCAVNGSLSFLLERGVTPWAVGVMDPRAHLADIVEARPGVIYFLASYCHPSVFDKMLSAGCDVVLWHMGWCSELGALIGDEDWIGGGATMGLRWPCLGYYMGFRKFDLHGLDSSFRGEKTHAYPDYRDGMAALDMMGYKTSINFVEQVSDWVQLNAMFDALPEPERPVMRLFGDGLLQAYWKELLCSQSPASTPETILDGGPNTSACSATESAPG